MSLEDRKVDFDLIHSLEDEGKRRRKGKAKDKAKVKDKTRDTKRDSGEKKPRSGPATEKNYRGVKTRSGRRRR